MTERDAPTLDAWDPRRIQVLGWSILLVAFAVFVALAIGGPWAAWRWAHLATRRAQADVRVTSGGLDRCVRSDCLPSMREDELWSAPENATLELAGGGNSAAFFRFADGSTAQLERFGRLRLVRLRRPLFRWGEQRPAIALALDPVPGGTVRLRAGSRFYDGPPDRAPEYWIDTPLGRIALAPETHLMLRLDRAALRISVEMGEATVTTVASAGAGVVSPPTTLIVRRGEQTTVRAGQRPSPATNRPENVLPDADFDRPPDPADGWTAIPAGVDAIGAPTLSHELTTGGRTAMHFSRSDSAKTPADLVLARDFRDFDLTDATWLSVAATVRIDEQSLPGGGDRAEEFPLIVTLIIEDADGNEKRWFVGFYSLAPDPAGSEFAGARIVEGRDVLVGQGKWTDFDTGNLLDATNSRGFAHLSTMPIRLKRLELKSSGHDFDAWVDRVEVRWK